jgi:hypothetical protein
VIQHAKGRYYADEYCFTFAAYNVLRVCHWNVNGWTGLKTIHGKLTELNNNSDNKNNNNNKGKVH